MLDEYVETQKIAYKILKNASKKKQFSHAYLIEANHYPKKLEFAIAFAKLIFCPNQYTNKELCQKCTQCQRIDDGNFTELKIISPDGSWIKKEQLEDLQREFSTKAIETNKKIYIINEAEKMNAAAANSILKFLEEPEEGIIAILITDNIYQLLDTIISRCQVISLSEANEMDFIHPSKTISTIEKISFLMSQTETEYQEMIESGDKREQLNALIQFTTCLEKEQKHALLKVNKLWTSIFKDKEKLDFGLELMIFYYKDLLNMKLGQPIEVFIDYVEQLESIVSMNTTLGICKKIQIIIQLKEKLKVNSNINLIMDKLVLSFQEVAYE